MNRFVFALVLSLAASALAETAWVRRDPPHVEWFGRPSYVDNPSVGRVWDPSDEICLANGWESFEYGGVPGDAVLDYSAPVAVRDMTQDELDARAAANAEAQAAAEALRGPAPEVFVPMLNSDGELVGTARLVVIEGSLSVLASTNSASPQRTWAEQKDQILAQLGGVAESRASAAAARLAIKQTVLAGDLAEEDLVQIVDLWPAWAAGVSYALDELVKHDGSLYKVVQAHTSQADWAPPDVPALFAKITPPGLIAEWVQPAGAHDTYSLGDLVMHVGQVWESIVDNNSWEPGVYGWEIKPGE